MENEKNYKKVECYVQGKNPRDKACKLIRSDGILEIEFKLKSKDKLAPSKVVIEAVEVVNQITAVMNQEERMKIYANLIAEFSKNETEI